MTKKDAIKEKLVSLTQNKAEKIKFIKDIYSDFKETLTEVLGDTGQFLIKHKVLLFIAFIAYLIYINKQFSIERFVNKLEERLKEDREW